MRDFSDENARDPAIVALRDRVDARRSIRRSRKTRCARRITLKDGRALEKFIEHVVGSLERPMSDADLEAKFLGLADGVLPEAQARALIERCWNVETLASAAEIATGARAV